MHRAVLPSIWWGRWHGRHEWERSLEETEAWSAISRSIDEEMLSRPARNVTRAWCVICESATDMTSSWAGATINRQGIVEPDWDEMTVCNQCGSNGRRRALAQFALDNAPGAPVTCVADRIAVDSPEQLRQLADRALDGTRIVFAPALDRSMGRDAILPIWNVPVHLAERGLSGLVLHAYWAPWQGHHGDTSFLVEVGP